MARALETVSSTSSFYAVHEALKKLDRKPALRFLDGRRRPRHVAGPAAVRRARYQSLGGRSRPAGACARSGR
jgi:hypothetical protein